MTRCRSRTEWDEKSNMIPIQYSDYDMSNELLATYFNEATTCFQRPVTPLVLSSVKVPGNHIRRLSPLPIPLYHSILGGNAF